MTTIGQAAHQRGVERLVDSYRAIPPDGPVRLAKKTSNLFRPRESVRAAGLDVSALDAVISVDTDAETADVQGMCTYEDLVDATLPHGFIPYVVPQLRTITLGGAVTGLGIESTSFRNGLPHESVVEMDILTGAGKVVTATPDGEHGDLFAAFPNSYGSLGYATRLRIRLERVPRFVRLRHERFGDVAGAAAAIEEIVANAAYGGHRVDGLDGVVFAPDEAYLTLAEFTDEPAPTSDYTGQQMYYRSIRQRSSDVLGIYDYLWRWDTDWFWCSRAFGAQHPVVRRLWPRRYRRSDVYHRLVGLENRYGVAARIDRARKLPARERVIQDVEVPVAWLAAFMTWFDDRVGMRPVWLCPLRLRDRAGGGVDQGARHPRPAGKAEEESAPGSAQTDENAAGRDAGAREPAHSPARSLSRDESGQTHGWPLYPLDPDETYVNVGFWGTVPIADGAADGDVNRAIEQRVTDLGGHKSLYSDAYYDRETFDRLYDGATWAKVKSQYDPEDRLTGMYEKAVGRR